MITYSIIQKSQLDGSDRLDAEYYQLEYLKIGKLLENSPKISEVANTYDLQSNGAFAQIFKILNDDKEKIVPYIRSENAGDFFINLKDLVFISKEAHSKLKKTQTKLEDVLMARKGKIGGATLVTQDAVDFNSNDNIVNIKIKNKKLLDPYYFAAFFNSSIGLKQVERFATGNVQPWLSMFQLRSLKVFMPELQHQLIVRKIVEEAFDYINQSRRYYLNAEELLLDELGLRNLVFEDDLSYIVNYSDAIAGNRMDPDYFQPKYELLIKKIQSKQTSLFSSFIKDYSTGYTFKSENYQEEGIPLIRINNIRKGFIDLTDTAYLSGNDYFLSPKDIAKPGDIVLSMSGTIGMSAVIPIDVAKCSINQRILRFTPRDIDPDLLALILNSIVGNFQLGRIGTGGVQTNISYKDIQNILIPILPIQKQKEIAGLVKKSHEARKKSKELLEEAKRKVEEMIEKGGEN